MHFALVENVRTAPKNGLRGTCPACRSVMIAKCGTQRLHHWAHKAQRSCDRWWEPETPWHRAWKNKFPPQWQEHIQADELGERHIADVHTSLGLVIEFQHSHLSPEERVVRESFYRNMWWVVDASRLRRDVVRFVNQAHSFRPIWLNGMFVTSFPDEAFPRSWLHSTVPVFFDFGNAKDLSPQTMYVADPLWCLLPKRALGRAVLLRVSREDFVRWPHDEAQPIASPAILANVEALLLADRRRQMGGLSWRAERVTGARGRRWGSRRPQQSFRAFLANTERRKARF